MPSPALILLWSTSAAAAAAPGLPQQRVWDIAAPPGSPDDHLPAVTAEMVAEINAGQSSWEAHSVKVDCPSRLVMGDHPATDHISSGAL